MLLHDECVYRATVDQLIVHNWVNVDTPFRNPSILWVRTFQTFFTFLIWAEKPNSVDRINFQFIFLELKHVSSITGAVNETVLQLILPWWSILSNENWIALFRDLFSIDVICWRSNDAKCGECNVYDNHEFSLNAKKGNFRHPFVLRLKITAELSSAQLL